MSIIGLSPNDIVNGARLVARGLSALRDDGGSREHFQQTSESHLHLEEATKALVQALSSTDVPDALPSSRSKQLAQRLHRQNARLQHLAADLGPNARPGKRHGTLKKLLWEFKEDGQCKDSDARSKPAVDAVLIEAILLQLGIQKKHHEEVLKAIERSHGDLIRANEERTIRVADNMMPTLREIQAALPQTEARTLAAMKDMQIGLQASIERALTSWKMSQQYLRPQNSVPKKKCRSHPNQMHNVVGHNRDSLPQGLENPIQRKQQASVEVAAVHPRNHASCDEMEAKDLSMTLSTDVLRALFFVVIATIYANPRTRKFLGGLLSTAQCDPVLTLLCLVAAFLTGRVCIQLPRQISLLSDSSILFEDAFGANIRIPFLQCEHYEIFHGFLEVHFRRKPGIAHVWRKQYHVLLGTVNGAVIKPSDWKSVVKPKCRLTLAILLDPQIVMCVKCSGLLRVGAEHACCEICGQFYLTTPNVRDDNACHGVELGDVVSDVAFQDDLTKLKQSPSSPHQDPVSTYDNGQYLQRSQNSDVATARNSQQIYPFKHMAMMVFPNVATSSDDAGRSFSNLGHSCVGSDLYDLSKAVTHCAATICNNLPSTLFERKKESSQCLARDRSPYPDGEFQSILQSKFPGGLSTTFFQRGQDGRCKLLCEWSAENRRLERSCRELSQLRLRNDGLFLYLREFTPEAGSTVWAVMQFASYEWLTVFCSTFIDLQFQEAYFSLPRQLAYDLMGERCLFAGQIRDGGSEYVLRVLQDKRTWATRLEASVPNGVSPFTPVWTASITEYLESLEWSRESEHSSIIYLAKLRRIIFSPTYEPQVAANGDHFLDFKLLEDAVAFVNTVRDPLGNSNDGHILHDQYFYGVGEQFKLWNQVGIY